MPNTFRFQDISRLLKGACQTERLRSLFSFGALAAFVVVSSATPANAQGLNFDQEHDVLVLPNCQVALKYNNKTFVPVKASSVGDAGGFFLSRPVEKSIRLTEDYSGTHVSQSPEQIFVECYDPGKIGGMGSNRFSKDFLKDHKVKEITMTSDKVAKETGLPLAAVQSLKAVKTYEVASANGGNYNLFVLQHDQYMTLFARQMRSGKSELNNDPSVIVTEIQFGPTDQSKGNVQL